MSRETYCQNKKLIEVVAIFFSEPKKAKKKIFIHLNLLLFRAGFFLQVSQLFVHLLIRVHGGLEAAPKVLEVAGLFVELLLQLSHLLLLLRKLTMKAAPIGLEGRLDAAEALEFVVNGRVHVCLLLLHTVQGSLKALGPLSVVLNLALQGGHDAPVVFNLVLKTLLKMLALDLEVVHVSLRLHCGRLGRIEFLPVKYNNVIKQNC